MSFGFPSFVFPHLAGGLGGMVSYSRWAAVLKSVNCVVNHRSSLVQLLDVGVDAPRQLVEGGFRVAYADSTSAYVALAPGSMSRCVPWDAPAAALLAALRATPRVAADGGVRSVTRAPRGHGVRFTVTLESEAPCCALAPPVSLAPCEVLRGADGDRVPDALAVLRPAPHALAFRYVVAEGDGTAAGLPLVHAGPRALVFNTNKVSNNIKYGRRAERSVAETRE